MAEEQYKRPSGNANMFYGSSPAGTGSENSPSQGDSGYDGVDAGLYDSTGKTRETPVDHNTFTEETAAEFAAPVTIDRTQTGEEGGTAAGGTGIGVAAVVLSIISLFVLPVLFAGAGIVLGFVARGRGAEGLGSWAIGIGVVSLILALFINLIF